MNDTEPKIILLIAANPKGTKSLRLHEEEGKIRESLRLGGKYDKEPIHSIGAARPIDIQRAMVDFEPQIVHIGSHGAGQEGLVFENESRQEKLVSSEALANLFRLYSNKVECVILNACYSRFQAEAIAKHIKYVIGMDHKIGDRAAIAFSRSFYTALGSGKSIEFAYELGRNGIELSGLQENLIPILFKNGKIAHQKSKHSLQQISEEAKSPTSDYPLLVGILVDVSRSMTTSIRNRDDKDQNHFEGFRKSLHKVVDSTKEICQKEDSEQISPLMKLFALGFGFGNPISFLFRGDSGERVRDLLILPNTSELNITTTINQLVNDWNLYEKNIERISKSMGGDTPMGEALLKAHERLRVEMENHSYYKEPILFILSDGLPTDVSPEEILEIIDRLKEKGVIVVSCYVTDKNVTKPECLHGFCDETWEKAAQLMFNCASVPPITSPFYSYFRELDWEIEEGGRLFAQINETKFLEKFLKVIISPLVEAK